MADQRWQLPKGIEELLPAQARRLERLRRSVLDTFDTWGYELIETPLVEYLDALLTGIGGDLDLQTFKLTDQVTGRLLGVRADMTPQVARIDAHQLRRSEPTRLCYVGPVLHAIAQGLTASRNPLQIGAELFGHAGIDADVEIILLMLETMHIAGLDDVYLDLGHVGVFSGLAAQAGLDDAPRRALFEALQRKARPEIDALLDDWALPAAQREMFLALLALNGDPDELGRAHRVFAAATPAVRDAVDEVAKVIEHVTRRAPRVTPHFDLAELRGYDYQNGICYAAYAPGQGQGVAWGGRYDNIGRVFGRDRPATGFSTDLKLLTMLGADAEDGERRGILAPSGDDPGLAEAIARLRAGGERVVQLLPGQAADAAALGCSGRLEAAAGSWEVTPVGEQTAKADGG